MLIDIHNPNVPQRPYRFTVQVDPKNPAPIVKAIFPRIPFFPGIPADRENSTHARDTSSTESSESGDAAEVQLHWDQALDDHGCLMRCPVCQCRELFARRDFPQLLGLAIVVGAIAISFVLFGLGYQIASLALLGLVVLADAIILYSLSGLCLVCYRCRSEFRDLPIPMEHPAWDLATGEKYRPADSGTGSNHGAEPRENKR